MVCMGFEPAPGRMESTNESTELWRHPQWKNCLFRKNIESVIIQFTAWNKSSFGQSYKLLMTIKCRITMGQYGDSVVIYY